MANSVIGSEPVNKYSVSVHGVTVQGTTKHYNTYNDMLLDPNPPKYAIVLDASDDPTVNVGRANYEYNGTTWVKIFEEEAMDRETDHKHENMTALDRLNCSENNKPLWDNQNMILQSDLDSAIESVNATTGEISTDVSRISGKLKYTFIRTEGLVDLIDQTYIIRGVKMTGRLPNGMDMPEDVCIRLIVDSDAASLGGSLICGLDDTVNGESIFRLNAAMDIQLVYDRVERDWVTIGTRY